MEKADQIRGLSIRKGYLGFGRYSGEDNARGGRREAELRWVPEIPQGSFQVEVITFEPDLAEEY